MPTSVLLKTCLRVSLCSLVLGTALLVFFFFANDLSVAFVSAPVVLALGLYNLKLLLHLLWRGYCDQKNRTVLWRTGLVMSLNIPAVLLYSKMVVVLNDTLLVRLVNTTSRPLHHLVVLGCGEQRSLADLPPGQAVILWLPISRNCFERTVAVRYTAGKATQQALVEGYVVEGKRINVQLGSDPQVASQALTAR